MNDRSNNVGEKTWIDGDCRWFYGGTPPPEGCSLKAVVQATTNERLRVGALFLWREDAFDQLAGQPVRPYRLRP